MKQKRDDGSKKGEGIYQWSQALCKLIHKRSMNLYDSDRNILLPWCFVIFFVNFQTKQNDLLQT